MIPYERQKKILSIIEEKELVKIDELKNIWWRICFNFEKRFKGTWKK